MQADCGGRGKALRMQHKVETGNRWNLLRTR